MLRKQFIAALMACITLFILQSCNKGTDAVMEEFKWSEHFISGTLSPTSSPDRFSTYLLLLDDEGTGQFITSTKEFEGEYVIQEDLVIFNTLDKEKWITLELENEEIVNSQYEVRFYKEDGTYEPAPVQYTSTTHMDVVPSENQLVGKQYEGNLYRIFTDGVFEENYNIKFETSELAYDSGSLTHIHYKSYGNVAYRSEEEGRKEFGTLMNGDLVVSFTDKGGFSYWGTFKNE